jgi:methylated-DNA-[protein]-cysteine S-methyltransferase
LKYYKTQIPSLVGELTIAGDAQGKLTGVWLKNQKHFGGAIADEICNGEICAAGSSASPLPPVVEKLFSDTREWLRRYFAGNCPAPSELPLSPAGETPFRSAVWQALLKIPYGDTSTYGALAKTLQTSARAIGNAVGHNPISIIIPCHRVLSATGTLTGYAGGLDAKQKLLTHEKLFAHEKHT